MYMSIPPKYQSRPSNGLAIEFSFFFEIGRMITGKES